ncbi:hypothetical protein [Methylosinus sp. PW1]|uniref:hypothetical protein n=1 Tax=Methylosinus sp. PW1 TaxID=107636 RepID=UPI000560DAF0|nr:hypothetical protein [Methylosinus sp. PW1]
MRMRGLKRFIGFALVAVSVIPPGLVALWLFDQVVIGLSPEGVPTLIMLGWISGAGLVGGIWIIKASN